MKDKQKMLELIITSTYQLKMKVKTKHDVCADGHHVLFLSYSYKVRTFPHVFLHNHFQTIKPYFFLVKPYFPFLMSYLFLKNKS